jgi:hypothetical protein
VIWGLALLLASVFTNVYIAITNEFPTIYIQMPIIDAIMMNLKWVVLFWLALICAVMFRKSNQEDDASESQRRFYGK